MDEADCKSELMKYQRLLLPTYFGIRIEDKLSAGWPDCAFTGDGATSWVEVKLARPEFKLRGVQERVVFKLARAGIAWYTVFYEVGKVRKTFIVPPEHIMDCKVRDMIYEVNLDWPNVAEGFDYRFVLKHLRRVHRDHVGARCIPGSTSDAGNEGQVQSGS